MSDVNIHIDGESISAEYRYHHRFSRGLYMNPIPYVEPTADYNLHHAWAEAENQVEAIFRQDIEAHLGITGKPFCPKLLLVAKLMLPAHTIRQWAPGNDEYPLQLSISYGTLMGHLGSFLMQAEV